jgi:hypothetical protein
MAQVVSIGFDGSKGDTTKAMDFQDPLGSRRICHYNDV